MNEKRGMRNAECGIEEMMLNVGRVSGSRRTAESKVGPKPDKE
jgi:hypothetical protein